MTLLDKLKSRLLASPAPTSPHPSPLEAFHSENYLRHTARRLEHLSSLGLPVSGKTVLDVSSGIGDHAEYYVDRGCKVTMTDVRQENLDVLKKRFPGGDIQYLDVENPGTLSGTPFEVVHCYGLLYHLGNPGLAIDYLSGVCGGMLLLETCVTPGDVEDIYPVKEDAGNPTWAFSGEACRPSRVWVFNRLKKHFEHVYMPLTQPNHPHFPIHWEGLVPDEKVLTRSIFIASRTPIAHPLLAGKIPMMQERHP